MAGGPLPLANFIQRLMNELSIALGGQGIGQYYQIPFPSDSFIYFLSFDEISHNSWLTPCKWRVVESLLGDQRSDWRVHAGRVHQPHPTPHSSLAFCTSSPFAMIAMLPIFVMVESEKEVGPEMPSCRAIFKDLKAFSFKPQNVLKASDHFTIFYPTQI